MTIINRDMTLARKIATAASFSATSVLLFAGSVLAADNTVPIDPGTQEGSNTPIIVGRIDLNSIVSYVITIIGIVAVLAALLFILWGALDWILSGGDKDKVAAARKKIVAAIIGLVVLILAFVILNLVLSLLVPGTDIFHLRFRPLRDYITEPTPAQ